MTHSQNGGWWSRVRASAWLDSLRSAWWWAAREVGELFLVLGETLLRVPSRSRLAAGIAMILLVWLVLPRHDPTAGARLRIAAVESALTNREGVDVDGDGLREFPVLEQVALEIGFRRQAGSGVYTKDGWAYEMMYFDALGRAYREREYIEQGRRAIREDILEGTCQIMVTAPLGVSSLSQPLERSRVVHAKSRSVAVR